MPEIIVKLGDTVVHKYIFDKEIMSVGRARDNDIVIENLSVSRNHARIRKEGDRFILTDLNSANGTYVNGVRITRVEIVNDDVVTVGKHKLHFIDIRPTDEEVIGEAFGAERTMLVDRLQLAQLMVSKGKQKDQEFKITKYETYIGRASDNDVRLHDWFVSKKHAVIIRQGANFFVKDLGSWRGTMVNGKNVRDAELKDGDEVQLGTTVLTFRLEGEAAVPQVTGRVPHEIGYEELDAEKYAERAGSTGPAFRGASVAPPPKAEYVTHMEKEEPIKEEAPEVEEPAVAEAKVGAAAEDEFAPLSIQELEQLEAEEEHELGAEEVSARGGGSHVQYSTAGLGEESQEAREEAFLASLRREGEELGAVVPVVEPAPGEEAAEEAALFGAKGLPTEREMQPVGAAAAPGAPPKREERRESPAAKELPDRAKEPGAPPAREVDKDTEVALWMKALKNKSRVIRREAARKLKHLTGKDYDWQSDPK